MGPLQRLPTPPIASLVREAAWAYDRSSVGGSEVSRGWFRMKCLIVYCIEGKWFGEDVSWKRSGSGTYREVSRLEVPQTQAEILKFAADNQYVIEWRGQAPADLQSA